jgi:putative hemolysin
LSFITPQNRCANNANMPMLRSVEKQGREAGVLANAPTLARLPWLAGKLLPLDQAHALYERVRKNSGGFVLEGLLREMNVEMRIGKADLERIPKRGPVVVVANHPYGMLDGAVLAVLLSRVRPDVKVMTNFLLEGVPELDQHCIFIDPLNTSGAANRNRRALKPAMEWLQRGGMLAFFPAGEVSH